MYRYLIVLSLCFVNLIGANEIMFVGIAGGTGSGKTTLTRKIQDAFVGEVSIIEQDSYYKDLSHLTVSERDRVNFDHPAALDFDLLRDHLTSLKNNRSIAKPVYNFVGHTRENVTVEVYPKRIVIVEGILLFAIPEIRDFFDLKIYVDNEDDIRLLRRLERDLKERGRSFACVRDQYMTTVKPMHDAFVEPSKWHADVIIPSVNDNDKAVRLILSALKDAIEMDK